MTPPAPAPDAAPAVPSPTELLTTDMARILAEAALTWSGRILGVLLLLTAAWIVGYYVRCWLGRLLGRARIDQTITRFLGNVTRWLIFLLGVVACLGLFGFNITSVAALVGAAGLTIGLALQGSLTNLAAGIMLMLLRPFEIGDFVILAGQVGQVDDLDLFNTKIDTPDNRRLIIPNVQVFGSTIENTTHHPERRIDLPLRVAAAADLAVTRLALKSAAEALPGRLRDRPVEVLSTQISGVATDWIIRVWVRTSDPAIERDLLVVETRCALDAAKIPLA